VVSTIDHLNIALCALRPLWPAKVRHIVRATSVANLERRFFRFGMRRYYRRADAVIFQSLAMEARYAELGVATRRSLVVNNPIDGSRVRGLAEERPESCPSKGPRLKLVSVGRLAPVKGYELLVRAVAMMDDKPIIDVVGDGESMPDLPILARSLGVERHVRFLGAQTNPYPAIAAADGLVLPSLSEGFPNTVLEALALGTPVIATPVAGLERLLGPIPGCEVAAAITPLGLAEALGRFCAAPRRRVDPSLISEFDAACVARRYEDLFDDLLCQR
jgi:glycosyltransferase involved in cell wall biosynthesis